MIKIEQQLEMGRTFFLGERQEINGGITVQDLQSIVISVASKYKDEQINVKNVFDMMKQVFHELDKVATHLSESKRKEIAEDLIQNIISVSRGNDVQAFTDRALLLLVEYSLDAIAVETLQEESLPSNFLTLRQESLTTEEQSIKLSPKIQQEDLLSRSRVEQNNFDLLEEVQAEQTMENKLLDPFLNESATKHCAVRDSLVVGHSEEMEEEVLIPSLRTSLALSKMATDNPIAIENQVEEVVQYIRNTSIEVDEKMALAQGEIQRCIGQALERVGLAHDKLKEVLEKAQELSLEAQGQVVGMVSDLAERLIEAIQRSNLPLADKECAEEVLIDLPNRSMQPELPIQEIIAGLTT